jgi:WD40 repeat protein
MSSCVPVIGILKVSSGDIFIRGQFLTTESKILYKHTCSFTNVASSLDSTISICDTQKNLFIFSQDSESSITLLHSFKVKKCPTAVQLFDNNSGNGSPDLICYVADKFGHVHIYPPRPEFTSHVFLSDDEEESGEEDSDEELPAAKPELPEKEKAPLSKPILGHVSMLTAIAVSPSFIVTGDRDEKIRVTDRLKPYLIHSVLLHHGTFISDLLFYKENMLISADGNGILCLWDLETFSLKREYPLGKTAIKEISLVNDSTIAVIFDQSNEISFVNCETLSVGQKSLPHPIITCNHGLISCQGDNSLYKIAVNNDGNFDLERACELFNLESTTTPFVPEPKGRLAKKLFNRKNK